MLACVAFPEKSAVLLSVPSVGFVFRGELLSYAPFWSSASYHAQYEDPKTVEVNQFYFYSDWSE